MIRIQNIYYMLSYAFSILKEQRYQQVGTTEFENVGDLCAEILIRGISSQIKRGIGKDYISKTEVLFSPRGKIDIASSLKQQTMIHHQLICTYDEFSVNFYMNRIIKTTIEVLLHSDIQSKRKTQMRKLLEYFADVESLDVHKINWKIQYNRNNQTYQMLVGICFLVIKGLLQFS